MKPTAFLALASLVLGPGLGIALPAAPALAQETASAGEVRITRAWARATAPSAPTGAAYVTLVNGGSQPDRLVSATSPVAERVEIHTHLHEGGVMRMREVEGVDLAPGAEAVFGPGGLHLMLMGLRQPLRRGESFPLTLTFARGAAATVTVSVAGPGAGGPEGAAHGGMAPGQGHGQGQEHGHGQQGHAAPRPMH
ncbi:copper chaperone PCu(A)C [Arenibaculum pallidiluteum]|uniref:copper chaperone PCu(A)C n=1 Tax=Arenibaculum pallidiluteum TaxID=2812559 RepID=UPI001A96010A|nr:copper chaperone PCu(A)C [Arenibaculum pallidiluteum]